jgi:hypothetical protein
MNMKFAAAALAAASLGWAAEAGATDINFDNLAVGTTLANQYAGLGVTFAPNAFSGAGTSTSGQAWATNTDMTIVASTGSDVDPLGTPSLVGGNLLRSVNGWFNEDGDASFAALFSAPVSTFSATFAGVAQPADVKLFAYNGTTLLGTSVSTATGQFTLSFSAPSITRVVMTPGSFNDWVGVDNIHFIAAAVPEPGTYALMLAGLTAVGGLARRRRAVRSMGPG